MSKVGKGLSSIVETSRSSVVRRVGGLRSAWFEFFLTLYDCECYAETFAMWLFMMDAVVEFACGRERRLTMLRMKPRRRLDCQHAWQIRDNLSWNTKDRCWYIWKASRGCSLVCLVLLSLQRVVVGR